MKVLLDTDIGDDIDDAFCLALLLKATEPFESVHVKTSFGDPNRRRRASEPMLEAARAMGLDDRREITSSVGINKSIEMPENHPWGTRYLYGDNSEVGDCLPPSTFGTDHDVALSIGPLTNLALSIREDRVAMAKIRHVVMAGEFIKPGFREHNVICDVPAAAEAFDSGIPIDVIPWSIGPMTQLRDKDIVRLMHAWSRGDPLCEVLIQYLIEFWRTVPDKRHMYDPMTVVALLHPEWFEWKPGSIHVDTSRTETRATTTLEQHSDGPHRVAVDVDSDKAREFMMDILCGEAR
jgi:purine nucleosidase/pyrimidine-specific ribonucleoside hydrolase